MPLLSNIFSHEFFFGVIKKLLFCTQLYQKKYRFVKEKKNSFYCIIHSYFRRFLSIRDWFSWILKTFWKYIVIRSFFLEFYGLKISKKSWSFLTLLHFDKTFFSHSICMYFKKSIIWFVICYKTNFQKFWIFVYSLWKNIPKFFICNLQLRISHFFTNNPLHYVILILRKIPGEFDGFFFQKFQNNERV